MSHSTISPGLSHSRPVCAWYGRYGSERAGSSLRCDARSQPLVTHGTGWPCWPTSQMSSPFGPMLRRVTKMSMSSELLDTHSLSASGPVTSVSCLRGAVTKETPLRPTIPCVVDSDEPDATPALVTPLAG